MLVTLKHKYMTFIYEVSVAEMNQLVTGQKRFDVLRFRRDPSIGDTIIYQLEHLEVEEGEEKAAIPSDIPDEYSVKIDFIFDDIVGALKKGYHGVGFSVRD